MKTLPNKSARSRTDSVFFFPDSRWSFGTSLSLSVSVFTLRVCLYLSKQFRSQMTISESSPFLSGNRSPYGPLKSLHFPLYKILTKITTTTTKNPILSSFAQIFFTVQLSKARTPNNPFRNPIDLGLWVSHGGPQARFLFCFAASSSSTLRTRGRDAASGSCSLFPIWGFFTGFCNTLGIVSFIYLISGFSCRLMFLNLPMSAMLELNSNLRTVPGLGFFTGAVFSVEIRKTHCHKFVVFVLVNYIYVYIYYVYVWIRMDEQFLDLYGFVGTGSCLHIILQGHKLTSKEHCKLHLLRFSSFFQFILFLCCCFEARFKSL